MHKFPVYINDTDTMKKIQELVARGYTRYTAGEVPAHKLDTLCYKFEDRYQITATPPQRWQNKTLGSANTALIPKLTGNTIKFWLLVSPGQGPVVDLETLQDTTNKRHRLSFSAYWGTAELVRLHRKEQAGNQTRWTWQLTKSCCADYRALIQRAVRHKREEQIRQILFQLRHMPCFAGMRRQAYELFRFAQAEYKRTFSTEWPHGDLIKNFHGRFKRPETLCAVDLAVRHRHAMGRAEKRLREAVAD